MRTSPSYRIVSTFVAGFDYRSLTASALERRRDANDVFRIIGAGEADSYSMEEFTIVGRIDFVRRAQRRRRRRRRLALRHSIERVDYGRRVHKEGHPRA